MPEQLEHTRPAALWTRSFLILTFCYFLLFISVQMLLSPFPRYVKEQFHASDVSVSLVTSLFALSAIASRFLTAALMKKAHRNLILLCGIAIAAGTTLAYPYADSFAVLLLMRIGFGVGFGMTSTIMPTLVSQIIPRSRIGEGIGYFGMSTSLAMSFGPIIGLSIMSAYGFPKLALAGTFVVVLMAPLLWGTRSIPPQPGRSGAASGHRPGQAASNHSRSASGFGRLLLPALLNVFIGVTYGGLLSFLALFGQEIHLANIGLFFLFNAISIVLIRPISGKLFDRRGHAAVIVPSAVLLFAALTLLSFVHSLPLLIVAALLYGLGFGAIQPTLQAWMLRDTPPERHGAANSLYYNATDLGIACGSMLLGAIASVTGYAGMYRYSALVLLVLLLVYGVSQLVSARRTANSY